MHITQKSAQNIVNEMKASIHRDINIMDENGVILASTDPTRRGKRIRERLPSSGRGWTV